MAQARGSSNELHRSHHTALVSSWQMNLPDLSDFSMVRKTTNRIENIMARARSSSNELHRSHTTLH
ncbi:Uncharacterized protein OBRU01_16832 [Operophtera brumata]|uniref:Uncharacterized protein n=1 Tax=Operophtera brumata TaxID=104452 RepID=A0A0L7L1S0_OPEBR|nr:Uncharacterized protein OBRU01_16832 [Operophtera brumata]